FEYTVVVTSGTLTNLPGGNVTSILVVLFADGDVITACPDTTAPDHEPLAKNVNGPQLPDPSPRTLNVFFVVRNTAGSAAGNELLVGGWKYATPVGSGVEVTFSATFCRSQLVPPAPR